MNDEPTEQDIDEQTEQKPEGDKADEAGAPAGGTAAAMPGEDGESTKPSPDGD